MSDGLGILSQEQQKALKDFKQGKETINFVFLKISFWLVDRERMAWMKARVDTGRLSRDCYSKGELGILKSVPAGELKVEVSLGE